MEAGCERAGAGEGARANPNPGMIGVSGGLAVGIVAGALALPGSSLAGSASYADPVGDAGGDPNISSIGVADDDGSLMFSVGLANRTVLADGESVQLYLDTDPAVGGDDHLAGRGLPVREARFLSRSASCRWLLPRSGRGAKLQGSIELRVGSSTARRSFSAAVR